MKDDRVSATPSEESLPGRVEPVVLRGSPRRPYRIVLPPRNHSTRASSPVSTISNHTSELYSDDLVRSDEDDAVVSEASTSDKNSVQNPSELDHIDDDRGSASALAPREEGSLPDNDTPELQSFRAKSKSGEKDVIQDMIDHHVPEPTLELGKSKSGEVSESPNDWSSMFMENLKESLEGNRERRAVDDVKDMSTVSGLGTATTPSISGGALGDVAQLPSVEAQLVDLKDLIDNDIQPSLRTNHTLLKEIHAFISNVDTTQTLAELQKRKDFIRQEIAAVLQLRKEDEKRVIDEYQNKRARAEAEQNAERERIIAEYERKKFLEAEKAKMSREELIMTLKLEEEARKQKEKEEWESFLRKQKEMEEREKMEQKKAEEELEEEMRNRLARFGFQPNQVEAMVKKEFNWAIPPATQATHQSTHQRALTRVQEGIDEETLAYYEIPHERDVETGSIIIFRELNQEEKDILFEHTRRLRTRKFESRLAIEFKTGPYSTEVKINPQLRVPPFLTWPTRFDDSHKQAGSQHGQDNAALVELTLFAIEKQMAKKKFFIPDGPLRPTVIDQKLRADFAKLPEKTLEDVDSGLSSTSWNIHLQSRAFQRLEPETAFIKKARQEAGSTSSNQILQLEDPEALSNSPQVVARRVLQWQLAHLCDETEVYVDTVQKLIDQFVPRHYAHPLLRRCWWCLIIIQRVCLFHGLLSLFCILSMLALLIHDRWLRLCVQ